MKDESNKKFLVTELEDIIYNPANVVWGALHRNTYGKGCLSPIYKIFSTDENPAFIECILRSPSFIRSLSQKTEGTVVKLKTLKPEAFLEMSISVAPQRAEQDAIAAVFEQIDNIITLHQRKCDELKNYKKGLLQQMFPQPGESFPRVRFPGFTDPWEQRKLGDVLSFVKDGTHGTHPDASEGPLLLSAKNIKNGCINWDESDRRISQHEYEKIHSTFHLMSGDVLMTIVGSIGEAAILKEPENITFQRSVAFLRPNEKITSEFLYSEIQTSRFQKDLDSRKSTSAQPGIYLGDLSEMPFSYPSDIHEQKQIGAFISKMEEAITLHQRNNPQ